MVLYVCALTNKVITSRLVVIFPQTEGCTLRAGACGQNPGPGLGSSAGLVRVAIESEPASAEP